VRRFGGSRSSRSALVCELLTHQSTATVSDGHFVCDTCESGLVSGAVVYGLEPLEKPADGNVLVCCSQPVRYVVIDL
jgi:hypothetical protein